MKSLGLCLAVIFEASLCFALPGSAGAADLGGAPRRVDTSPAISRGAYWGITIGAEGGTADFKNFGSGDDPDLSKGSAALGGLVGYNFVSGPWLWGVEADLSGTSFRDSADLAGLGTVTTKSDWFGSLRLRGGYTRGDVLLYATAGLALSQLDVKSTVDGHQRHIVNTGLALGLGGEYALDAQWTARLEGLVYGFDSDVTLASKERNIDWGHSTLRLGLLRKF